MEWGPDYNGDLMRRVSQHIFQVKKKKDEDERGAQGQNVFENDITLHLKSESFSSSTGLQKIHERIFFHL